MNIIINKFCDKNEIHRFRTRTRNPVTVKGKLGSLTKEFKHIPFEMLKEKSKKSGKDSVKFRMWLQKKKRNAVLGTVRSIIRNMINGVTNGYKFKMVLAYAHFPIVVNIVDNGRVIYSFIQGCLN